MEVSEVIRKYLEEGKTGSIATIADKLGAAPRGEGAKMFVGEDGKFFGTIGGGCMEAEVLAGGPQGNENEGSKFVHYRIGRERTGG